VVEFGAAAALPSLAALHLGCRACRVTDYPSEHVLAAVRANVAANADLLGGDLAVRCVVAGHLWGSEVAVELQGQFDVALVGSRCEGRGR
jgi:predicted nicotinamide N-methyase